MLGVAQQFLFRSLRSRLLLIFWATRRRGYGSANPSHRAANAREKLYQWVRTFPESILHSDAVFETHVFRGGMSKFASRWLIERSATA